MNIKKMDLYKIKLLKFKKTIASALITFNLSTSMIMVAQDYAATELSATQAPLTSPLFKAEMLTQMLPNMLFFINDDGSFALQDGHTIVIRKLLAKGGSEDVCTIDLTQGEIKKILESGKELFDANFIAPGFLEFCFGIKEQKDFNGADSNRSSVHTDCITMYFETATNTFFKISHPDFWVTSIQSPTTDPQKLIVNLHGLQRKGAETGLGKRVFFDLTTKTFGETIIDLCHFPSRILNENCLCEEDIKTRRVDFYPYQIVDQKLVKAASPSCSILMLPHYNFSAENILTYTRSNGQYKAPYMLNLNEEQPIEVPLLTPSEIRALKLDVYDPVIIDGLLYFRTHGEKRVLHCKPVDGLELGKKGQLIQKIIEKYSSEICLILSGNLYGTTPEKIQEIFCNIFMDYQQYKHDLGLTECGILEMHPETERILLNLLETNKNIFIEIFNKYIFPRIFKFQFAKVYHTSIETADPKFKQVLYYTKPEGRKPDGYFIVDVHGGPHARVFNELSTEQQFFSNRGYPYVLTNIRGSKGFGSAYEFASNQHWYDVVDDIQKIVEWARETGIGKHPIIMGASFGGYVAAACFAKGISNIVIPINGIFDPELYERNLSRTSYAKSDFKKQYGETKEEREQTSVITHLTKKPGKMFIFCGLKDTICLPEQSRALFEKMRALGNNVEMVSFQNEGHGLSVKGDIVKLRIIEQFLGDITGYSHEPNGYGLLATHLGIAYERSQS
ncbi:MAG: hypothetical protein HEEMFOPI_01254 [Holosporales bacterium]